MWALLSRRLWLWALFALGVPALSWALGALGDRLERRHGRTTLTRTLAAARGWLRGRTRGPLADRSKAHPARSR